MSETRALTRGVMVGGKVWEAGSVPPPEVAARIKNPMCWAPVEPDPGLPWDTVPPPAGTAAQAVLPAAPATNGIHNLHEQPGGTEQTAVISADQGVVIGRDATEPTGQPEPASETDKEPGETGSGSRVQLDEPPRSGRGASETSWRQFAASRGVTVAPLADRAAIIAACRKAGVIQ